MAVDCFTGFSITLIPNFSISGILATPFARTAFNNFRGTTKLTFQKEPPTTRASLVIILGVSGGGLTLMSIAYGTVTFFEYHIFPLAVLLMMPTVITGVSLIVVTYFVRRTYKH